MAISRFQSPDFSLRQLQYAVAVAETGGFGSAAERCGVSQPSLSAQVAKLEDVLGVRLFERDARGVELTEAGRRLLVTLRSALAAASEVEIAAATLRDPYAIPLRVAVIPTVAPYLLPAVVDVLREQPGPRVHWLELQTAVAEDAVLQRSADAMIIADPPTASGLIEHELGWEPFFAAVPAGSDTPDEVDLDWLGSREVLLLEDGHCLRDHIVSLCRLQSAQESPFRATSLPTLVQMVSAGMGVSVLPAMAVRVECSRARVDPRPISEGTVGRNLRLVWRAGHPMHALLDELAERVAVGLQRVIACDRALG